MKSVANFPRFCVRPGLAVPVFGVTALAANGLMLDSAPDGEKTPAETALGATGSGIGYTGVDDLSPCLPHRPVTRTRYKSYGISSGLSAADGGVLDGASVGVTNTPAGIPRVQPPGPMSNGGKVGPERLVFSADAVQLSIGSGADVGAMVEVSAKTADGGSVDSQTVTLASSMQTVFLQGTKKIKKVVIGGGQSNACIFAVDNIFWGTPE